MDDSQNRQSFKAWVNNASPEDLIDMGKTVVARIGQLDQTHRDRFTQQLRSDPQAKKLLETQPA